MNPSTKNKKIMINQNRSWKARPVVQMFCLILIVVSNNLTGAAGEERTLITTNTTKRPKATNRLIFLERTVDQPAARYLLGVSSHEDDGDSTSSTIISQTQLGWILPTVIGSVSFIASSLVIYIIIGLWMSKINHHAGTRSCCCGAAPTLSPAAVPCSSVLPRDNSSVAAAADTYHRTILCLCISDMIISLSIALSTIPMPKDVHDVYSFDAKSYGSAATCEVQAFSYVLGSHLSFCASSFLTLYYLLTIRYQIPHRIMTKYIEPCGLLVSLSLSVLYPIDKLRKKMFNPLPFISWCAEGDYPFGCTTDESVDCIRGQESTSPQFFFLLPVIAGTAFQVISFALITNTIYRREKYRHNFADPAATGNRVTEEILRASHTNYNETKATATQCFMYSLAFIFTHFFLPQISARSGSRSTALQVLSLISRPIQGLLNAIIFIYDKVYILRVATDWSISFSESLATTIRNPASSPGVVIIFEDQEMHPNNSELILHPHKIIMQSWLMTKRIHGSSDISDDSSMIDSVNSGIMSKVNSAIEDDIPSINSAWERESNPVSEDIF